MKSPKFSFLRSVLSLLIVLSAALTAAAQANQTAKAQTMLFDVVEQIGKPVSKITPYSKPQAILFARFGAPENHAAPVPQSAVLSHRAVRARIVATDAVTPKFAVTPTALEKQVFDLINAERRSQNLPDLVWDAGMLFIARRHSENMLRLGFISHTGQDGLTADGRAAQAGIDDWRRIGENIAFSQNVQNPAERAVSGWMKSEGHRRNILNQNYAKSGIGIVVAPNGKFYATQVFRN